MKHLFPLLLLALLAAACQQAPPAEQAPAPPANPPAPGFRAEASDSAAIALADQAMLAMGGRRAWDTLQSLQWTFFGRRHLLWDKRGQRVRIEFAQQPLVMAAYLDSARGGQVWQNGQPVEHPDSLAKYLARARSIWINDAYWLCMPFKLKDSGVALRHDRPDTTQDGRRADVLALTFEAVGDTPHNKYEVWIDRETKLVSQWAYFEEASQDSADFVTPWADYQAYGALRLSGSRGRGQLEHIRLPGAVPDSLFFSPAPRLPLP